MKKCLVGLLCLGMAVTATLGDLSYPAPLPVNWAGGSGYTTANIKAMPGWNAVGLGTPYTKAGASAKFDHAGDSITVYIDGAPGTLTSGARRSNGTALTEPFLVTIKESSDNNNWTVVRSFDGNELDGTIKTFEDTLQSTTRYVKYEYETKAEGQNFGLASVQITSGGPAVFSVSLDKQNGFEVAEGSSATITATAANGTEPYGYVWDSTLGATYYTAADNTFTVLATAPTGTYSATVTATDSASDEANATVTFSVVEPAPAEGIVDFRFNEAPFLQVTAKDANLTVSDMALTAGTIETGIDTGTYFPDEPYIEETAGWTATSQAEAKAFVFTITPAEGATVTINGLSFNAYATAAGPSAFGFDVGGVATYEVNAPNASLLAVSQAVVGVESATGPIEIKIQGWLNGSRDSKGTGVFRLDDVVVHGSVSTGPAEFRVWIDKEDNFTVEQGTAVTFDAETANGVGAPGDYNFVWTTDMDANEYATMHDGFQIKDNASTGTYYATVMVTDLADNTGTATIHFSVVPPVVKYPITIVTNAPANGTVTTTPAEQAAAGAPVTINATPADGYAVGTITVTAADTSNVPVAGSTFNMPAQGVTVSVTFTESAAPNVLITFEDGTLPTAYALNTATLEDGKVWSTERVVRGNLEADKKIGTLSARMAPVTGTNAVLQLTEAYPDSISRISYWVASYGSDNMANVTLTVEVSTNGLEWTSVETLAGAADITGTMTERVIETIPENAVYLRFVATAQATSNKRINLDNIGINLGEPIGVIKVNIAGNLSGTVNNQMSLEITLQNAIADDWWFTLKDPDNLPDYNYTWKAGTGEFLFTPSKVGNYTLTAEAVDAGDTPIASKTVTLAVSAATDVSIPPIVIVPGGFTFELPEGYTLANVYGADMVVEGDDFPWILLTSPTDYVVEGTTVTIKTDPAQRRLFRIYWQ